MADAETPTDPIEVLLVEDNPGDVRLAQEAFDAVDRPIQLTVATDGTEALDHLRTAAPEHLPALVLLDLNLPGADGRTVLRECKSRPTLRHTPVVVFTSSEEPEDVRGLYDAHANAYVPKPRDADGYFDTVQRLDAFWFSTALLPEVGRS
ncbi:response regulator [Halorarius litoreus]|uniref:response regulator n=1 Tax=Halorarius litoreus TaxID=2962676 RepID=UPI0020CB7E15|nr:response regulator [Halorarius litoreus]